MITCNVCAQVLRRALRIECCRCMHGGPGSCGWDRLPWIGHAACSCGISHAQNQLETHTAHQFPFTCTAVSRSKTHAVPTSETPGSRTVAATANMFASTLPANRQCCRLNKSAALPVCVSTFTQRPTVAKQARQQTVVARAEDVETASALPIRSPGLARQLHMSCSRLLCGLCFASGD